MQKTIDELKAMDIKNINISDCQGYANNGHDLIEVRQDRFDKRRFLVWSVTRQSVIQECRNKTAAVNAFLSEFSA